MKNELGIDMSCQQIAANSPIEKIMSPMLRILLIFERAPLIPANKPAREKREVSG